MDVPDTSELNLWMLIIHLLDTGGEVLDLEGVEAGHAFELWHLQMPKDKETKTAQGFTGLVGLSLLY